MKSIGLNIAIGGVLSSSLKSTFSYSKDSISQLGSSIRNLNKQKVSISRFRELSKNTQGNTKEFVRLGRALRESGIDLKNLSKHTSALNTKLLKLKKNIVIKGAIQKQKDNIASLKTSLIGIGSSALALSGVIHARGEVLKAQGEIKSLGMTEAPFGRDALGIKKITQAAKEFSNTFAGTSAPEFIRASYDIKSGIASLSDSGVAEFTRLSALTASATKSSTETMTKLFALGHGIFKDTGEDDFSFGNRLSASIAQAVKSFRTDGDDLALGISNIGAQAKKMGVSLNEELSIIGTAKSAFNSASEAATAYRAFLDGTAKAQEKLGLRFTDAQGKMLPMIDILHALKNSYGDMANLATQKKLKDAFGSSEAIKIISALKDCLLCIIYFLSLLN